MVYVVFSVMMMVMFVGVCGASASLERRKEVRELTSEEWDRFAGAVNEFRLSGRWEEIANLHTDPKVWQVAHSDESGLQAAFLPWHRVFLRRMEGELQRIDPKVTMPYWNWALDSEDPAGSPVLSPDFFGGSGDPETSFCVTEGSFSDLSNETCVKRLIPRDSGGFLTLSNLKEVLVENPDYGRFVNTMENGLGLHGHLHMFLGGDMARVNSPKDPLFYAHHAFIDKLWWEWQMMHNELGSPAYKGNATAPLYPFEESASDVFSVEDMGYTYSDPLVRDPSDNSTLPRYLELGGEEDIVALGERVWRGLPNNVTALKAVVKTAPRPASKFYVAWHEMKSQAALGQAQPASPDLLAAEIDHVANILTEPRVRTRALDSVTRGLGIPVTKILEDAEIDSPEAGSPANLSCPNYDVCLSCPCEVTMYSTSFNEDLKNAIKTEVAFIRDDPWDEYLRLGGQEAAAEEMEALDGCDPDDPLCAEQTVDAGVVEGEDSSSGGGSDGVVDPEVGGGEGGHGGNETKPSIAETMSNVFQKVEPLFDDPMRTTDDVETALLTDGVVFESSVEEALAKVQAMPTILPPLSSVAYDPNATVVEEPVAEPKAEVVEEPVAEPKAEVVEEPVAEPKAEVVKEPVAEPKAEVVEEPVAAPKAEVVEEPVAAPNAEVEVGPVELSGNGVEEPKAEVVEEPVAAPNAEVEVGPVELSGNGVEEPKAEVVEEPVPAVAVVQSKPGEVHVGEQDTVAAETEKVRLEWEQARQKAEEARQKAEEARLKAEEKAREAQEKARQKAKEARQKAEERAREAQEKQEERRRQIDARLESMMASVTANMHRVNMDNAAKLNELKTLEEQIKSSELMSQQRMDLELRLQGEQEAMLKRQIDRELEAVQVALRRAEREVEEFQAAAEEARRAAEEKQQELAETARKVVEEKKEKAGKKVEEARRKAQVRAREAREMVQQKVEEARQKAEEARLNSDKKAREAQEKARQKAEEARQKAEEFRLKAEERARETQEKARQKVEEARERAREAQEKARQKAEEARQKAEEFRLKAEERAREAREKARQKVEEARERAEEARQKAEERVREARERARQKAEKARQKVEEAKRKAQEWAREAREKARQKAEEARQKVEERAREAKEKLQRRLTRRAEERAREKAERAREKAEEARQKAEEAVRGR